ncbi:hypothetical protein GOV04_02570 [Candidatus Woesearchaeota archaeon]|nr:hypothetical protein [Candidatus Woesearchaeota archaeon]
MIKQLSDLINNDYKIVGGKASALAKLLQKGFNVPQGFVITTDEQNNLDKQSNTILSLFDGLKTGSVAVRSSANLEDSKNYSFAGQFNSYLGVRRDQLINTIKKCFNRINNPSILAYSKLQNIKKSNLQLSVLVQPMIKSSVSGVCFTKHPVSGDTNTIFVEAGIGFGEALVSGIITPDQYLIDKKSLKILDKKISVQDKIICFVNGKKTIKKLVGTQKNKQKLSDKQILHVAKQSIKIERFFKQVVDVEYSFTNKKFYVLQARTITT